MWSGPRNISTAMMRAWGNRPDTFVCDEPLYAHYLQATGLAHPGADEVIAAGETDPRKVAGWLTGPVPEGKSIFYQKHMTHHLLPGMEGNWLDALTHCFLIREPGEVITSYLKKNHDPTVEDLGFAQQAEIFEWVRGRAGAAPPVLDARDVLDAPGIRTLRRLCARPRRRVRARDAVLGTGPPGDGRCLGEALVSRSGDLDRLPPLPGQAGRRFPTGCGASMSSAKKPTSGFMPYRIQPPTEERAS